MNEPVIEVFYERGDVLELDQTYSVGLTTERLTLTEDSHGAQVTVLRQGQPGAGLEFDWQGNRLGLRREGESEFDYQDLGRAFGAGGWALFTDTQYTEAAPLLLDGTQRLELNPTPNLTFAPEDASAWYDGVHFKPRRAGESYLLRLSFTALPLVAERELAARFEVEGRFTLWGDQTELSRGAGVAQRVSLEPFVYALETFAREGAVFALTTDGPLECYDFTLLAVRLVE